MFLFGFNKTLKILTFIPHIVSMISGAPWASDL